MQIRPVHMHHIQQAGRQTGSRQALEAFRLNLLPHPGEQSSCRCYTSFIFLKCKTGVMLTSRGVVRIK